MNLPDEFIEKYTKLLGDEAESFFESFDTEPQKGFRLNPLKSNYQNVALNGANRGKKRYRHQRRSGRTFKNVRAVFR